MGVGVRCGRRRACACEEGRAGGTHLTALKRVSIWSRTATGSRFHRLPTSVSPVCSAPAAFSWFMAAVV